MTPLAYDLAPLAAVACVVAGFKTWWPRIRGHRHIEFRSCCRNIGRAQR